ncbi:ABC transporter permease [Paenibacillus cymbidii]|uniref:ABC transporter permease n=1 Tax=Paenibacillus cymbidii TaxID=1639034 RepID=UPI001081B700|nr:ABC transporter permease subunit [Paenibacillus cymbidii]
MDIQQQAPPESAARQTVKRISEWTHLKRNRELVILSIPMLVFEFLFAYCPLIFLIIAFKNYRYDLGLFGSEWVGFKNFRFFFVSHDALHVTSNTVLYNMAFIVLTTVCALALAILMNEIGSKWVKVHQTVLFLPYFLSWVVVGYIVQGFLNNDHGFMNELLKRFHMEPVNWYTEPAYWPWIIMLSHLWKTVGYSALIYYAGIMGIEPSYYEAALIDGASKWQRVWKITLPLLVPLILILFIINMGGIFRAEFGLFYFVPNDVSYLFDATDVIDTYVYRSLKKLGDLGMSTAVGLYQSVVGLVLVLAANAIIKKINKENALW